MIDGLERETSPPELLKARVLRSLEQRGLLRTGWRFRPVLVRVAALVLVFSAGWLAGGATRVQPDAPAASGSRYLLILYEDESFKPEAAGSDLVAEYTAWASRLRSEGRLFAGEELGAEGWLMGGPPVAGSRPEAGPYGEVTGFFVIAADDPATALEIARTCPHVRHGGRIAVRPIRGT